MLPRSLLPKRLVINLQLAVIRGCNFLAPCYSRGEAEGPDGDCQGPPWDPPQGVQPHQLGAQSAGQEAEEGEWGVMLRNAVVFDIKSHVLDQPAGFSVDEGTG